MRVVIDCQGLQSASANRGIGRYSRSLVDALLAEGEDCEFWLVLNSQFEVTLDALIRHYQQYVPRERIRVLETLNQIAWQSRANHPRALAMEDIRNAFVASLKPDVVLLTSLFEGFVDDAVTTVGDEFLARRTAVIHYDLIPALVPGYLDESNRRAFYEHKLNQLSRAGRLLAISHHSRHELCQFAGLDPSQVVAISAAASAHFTPDTRTPQAVKSQLQGLGIVKPFVLCVPGGFDPRKNMPLLISSFGELGETLKAQHQLVIVGRMEPFIEAELKAACAQAGLAEQSVVFTGFVEDSLLRALYSATKVFVFPSCHEGFGLPVLEALRCGAPVIAANATSVAEIVGEPEAMFEPNNAVALHDKLLQALEDTGFRARLRVNASEQAQRFSWQQCARDSLAALSDLAQENGVKQCPSAVVADLPTTLALRLAGDNTAVSNAELAKLLACNFPSGRPRRLLLDVSVLHNHDAKSGIQRVVRSLMTALMAEPPPGFDVLPVYFDAPHYRVASRFLNLSNNRIKNTLGSAAGDVMVDTAIGDTYLALDLNWRQIDATLPLLRRWRQRGVHLAFVVYDLLPVRHPYWWPQGMGEHFEAWLRNVLYLADTVCCISQAVAADVTAWIHEHHPTTQFELPCISSFHLGADIDNSQPSSGLPGNFERVIETLQSAPTFLMVGTLEPRKGYQQTLAAFEALWNQGVSANLVLVGKRGWLMDDWLDTLASHPQMGVRLFWFESASDECLERLYDAATCLIAASEAEGFGLPLIEAARHGVPLLVRDIPVFREVAGGAASYFDGLAPQQLAHAVKLWLKDWRQDNLPSVADLAWLTWCQSAQALQDVLHLAHHVQQQCPAGAELPTRATA